MDGCGFTPQCEHHRTITRQGYTELQQNGYCYVNICLSKIIKTLHQTGAGGRLLSLPSSGTAGVAQADTNNRNTEHLRCVLPLPAAVKQELRVPAGLLAGERGITAPDLSTMARPR